MRWKVNALIKITQAILLGSLMVVGTATSASAQDPYWHDRNDKRALKRHQKEEQRELKYHQRLEREEFGNSKALKRHQKEEQRELKQHQKREHRSVDRRDW